MKKFGRHYLRRCLSVLLAVLMVCAAAQTLVFAVDLDTADTVTPGWNEGTARARYTTSGTLEISFPEADVKGDATDVTYYADFYDLDKVVGNDYSGREAPVNNTPYELSISGQTLAEGDATQLLSASLTAGQIKELTLDMSHRISIAITAVKGNWRSEAIEALVGESLDIPDSDVSPNGSDRFVSFADFNVPSSNSERISALDRGYNNWNYDPAWEYNDKNYYYNGNDAFVNDAMNVDGVFGGAVNNPENRYRYQKPGFVGNESAADSGAFRLYVKEQSQDSYQTLDIQYNQDHWQFINADELWIWVDTSYVEFDEFALRVRTRDYTGTVYLDSYYQNNEHTRGLDLESIGYSETVYSTVGYANRTEQGVPVYYLNEDGIWDTRYTNKQGYLEDFGHYRGFLRVPVEYLQNEDENSPYVTLHENRPLNFTITVRDYYDVDGDWQVWPVQVAVTSFNSIDAYENPLAYQWDDRDTNGNVASTEVFNVDRFNQYLSEIGWDRGIAPTPSYDITSVGIQWKGASEDSVNKPFYIDQIGFSGEHLETNTPDANYPGMDDTLDNLAMIPNEIQAVTALFNQYIPDPTAVNASNASILEDFQALCSQLGIDTADISGLNDAIARLNEILAGGDVVSYMSAVLSGIESVTDANRAAVVSLFELYQTLTLGEINRLGRQDEAKLINLYNSAGQNVWIPNVMSSGAYLTFNDFENDTYSIGQTALHQYDNYVPTPDGDYNNFNLGHILNWSNTSADLTQAWENSRNFVAYSREGYADSQNDTDQRFGYGVSTIGQDGFMNSKSAVTDIYRSVLTANENYRISLTANGQDEADWDDIEGVNANEAEWLTFYADFTHMNDFADLWVIIRDGSGAYASNQNNLGMQIISLDTPAADWQPASVSDLNGFRGFVRMPLANFGGIGRGDIRQIKFFVTGKPDNANAAGSWFSIDMVGFLSNESNDLGGQTLKDQYYSEQKAPAYDSDASDQFANLLDNNTIFKSVRDVDGTTVLKLFDRTAVDESSKYVYDQLIAAYNTMTLSQKETADEVLQTASGEKYKGVDELQLFVKNYDPWGELGDGQLKMNAQTAFNQREKVENAFTSSGSVLYTAPVVAILGVYDSYPDYYKYSVQTYWPDRNLNAVFPNYHPESVFAGNSADNPVKLTLDGTNYTGTFTLPYEGAVAEGYGINFTDLPKTLTLTTTDNQSIQVSVVWNTEAVEHGEGKNLTATFSIAETAVTHAGTYNGDFTITIDKTADTGTNQSGNGDPVTDAADYRKSGIKVYVQLVSQATFTVTIPAMVNVPWGSTITDAGAVTLSECSIPSTANVEVTAENDGYALVDGQWQIPYTLTGTDNMVFLNGDVNTKYSMTVDVASGDWKTIPISDDYQDTVTFTVQLNEQA